MRDYTVRLRAWRAFLLKGAGLLVLALTAACGSMGDDNFEFTVGYGPSTPDEMSASDHSAPVGTLRVSKVLLSGEAPLCGKHRNDPLPPLQEGEDREPVWTISLTLEGSGFSAEGEVKDTHDYLIVQGVRINPPAQLGVEWEVRDLRLSFVGAYKIGSGFYSSFGLGYGHAVLDVQYTLVDGRALDESFSLNGLDLQGTMGFHFAKWLAAEARFDFLIESRPLIELDAVLVLRPWRAVGILAGIRFTSFSDNKRAGSELYLDASGPLIGLDLRF